MLLIQQPCVRFPAFPEKFAEEKIIVIAEVNLQRWLEKSRQCLENVDPTHLVLASGKSVLPEKVKTLYSLVSLVFPLIIYH